MNPHETAQTITPDHLARKAVVYLRQSSRTCDVLIPRDRYDPFELLALVDRWNADLDTKWWRVSIQEPGGRTFEVDAPSGLTSAGWEDYARRYYGPGPVVVALLPLPPPSAPVNLDEALRAACKGVAGIPAEVFRRDPFESFS